MLPSPAPLHLPDGFLSLPVSLIFWALSVWLIWLAVSRANREPDKMQVPLMGIMAAFVFAAQMLNFPVAGGTSGHFLGGALVAIVLGPWAGMLVMTAVVAMQALLFQDGGLLVMGANIFNMGLLTAAIGFGFYRMAARFPQSSLRLAAAGLGAWLSTLASALLAALQLWLSGTARLEIVAPAMLSVHALIGIGEALITVAALNFIQRNRPDLLDAASTNTKGGKGWMWAGALVSLAALFLTPFASTNPDGLERVAAQLGILSLGKNAPFQLIPDYTIPFLGETPLSTLAAGLVGALVVAGVIFLIGSALRNRNNR